MIDPFLSARDLRAAIARGETSARGACEAALTRIRAFDPALHAFQHVAADRALARADALDRHAGPRGPLHGVPVALKDNLCTRDVPTTAGSRALDGYCPPYDATVVTRLEHAGAVVIGKTVCDEFAMGSSTENSAYGPTRNPWDHTRVPGGSSGGSAAAVAAGLVPLALGSDTGGSIRQPAAFCGVVGLKPTYGRVSRYGLIAFASSLDHIGPLTRSVDDAALVLDAISGRDPMDATSSDGPATQAAATSSVAGLTIGIPRRDLESGVDPDVHSSFERAVAALEALGARTRPIELPHHRHAIAVYYLLATAEASANLARYDGVRYGVRAPGVRSLAEMYSRTRAAGFGAEVKRRVMLGTYALSAGYYDAYYRKAQQVRALIAADYTAAFAEVDLIALPTTPTPAFRFGEKTADPLQMYLADIFTVGANLAGLPAVSVPCGLTPGGLPVGLQLIGRPWEDAAVLEAARGYEREQPFRKPAGLPETAT